MQRFKNIKIWFPYVVSLLFILLFTYAAVSKLVDYQNFKVQLGQSPLLVSFGHFMAMATPLLELGIILLLCSKKFRLIGLYASFVLMVMFTVYIVLILNYSPFVPCSCGGILDNMGWTEHLIFNIVFVLLAGTGILVYPTNGYGRSSHTKIPVTIHIGKKVLRLALGLFIGIFSVLTLYGISDNMAHQRNNFNRLLPPHPITKSADVDLEYNSFYFSGSNKDTIYLGNLTAPLFLKKVNLKNMDTSHVLLKVDVDKGFRFRPNTKTYVLPPYFYTSDGVSPRLWRGRLGQWHARGYMNDSVFFSEARPIAPKTLVIRAVANKTGQNELGLITDSQSPVKLAYGLLKKQVDGIFCTDGSLSYNKVLDRIIYLYYYRNQYLVMDDKLNLVSEGKTIDTNSIAKIRMETLEGEIGKMSTPPLMVNKRSSTYDRLFFVNSALMANNEVESEFKGSDVIDIYNLENNTYGFSFYVPRFNKFPIRDMLVQGNQFLALQGTHLVIYKLETVVFDRFIKPKK